MAEVTAILPVYNGEAHVGTALASLAMQSLGSVQVIVVDDASTDRTVEIVQHEQASSPQIKLVRNNSNVGVTRARLTAMDHVETEFVAFIDADDWLSPTMYERMLAVAGQTDSQLVVCNAVRVFESGRVIPRTRLLREEVLGSSRATSRFADLALGGGTLWNRLFRTELYRSLPHEQMASACPRTSEDYVINFAYLQVLDRCAVIPDYLYAASERVGSLSRTGSAVYRATNLMAAWAMCHEMHQESPEPLRSEIDCLYQRQLAYGVYGGPFVREEGDGFSEAVARLESVRPQLAPLSLRAPLSAAVWRVSDRFRSLAHRCVWRARGGRPDWV